MSSVETAPGELVGRSRSRRFANLRVRERILDATYPALAFAALLLAWELWVRLTHQPAYVMVPFSDVLRACFDNWGQLVHHTWVTTREGIYGYALGAVVGMGLAVLMTSLRAADKGLFPLIVVYHV